MSNTVYRFLPSARRGLAAALPDESAPQPVPARAVIELTVDITGAGPAENRATLHGPGDVIGLDPGQVVRTTPRPDITDAEPNFFAAVDLDAPELPWLFTPRGMPADDRLPPWLVLIVVSERDGVDLSHPTGAPLPQLHIDAGAADELPDLADSWAWAHVQLVEPEGGAGDVADTLARQPDRNVARLLCPRRLAPNRRWYAGLVPAYDAGVVRGLGGRPDPTKPLGPAWGTPPPDAITLPLYFHWQFQTGPEGDFEALAQRLKPVRAATTVGFVPMHVGEAAPPLRVPVDQRRILDMDGALRAPARADGAIDEVPGALRTGLRDVARTLADAADGRLDGQALIDDDRQAVGPPIYASSHVRRWTVKDTGDPDGVDPTWFRELNLDPRPRVSAGLGAECVRANQEDIADAAWRQVGDVMAAEAALQRAALSKLVAASLYRRTVINLPDTALLTLVAPAAPRTPALRSGVEQTSLTTAIAQTSLPDAVMDAGLRRALAPAGRAVQRAARRLGGTTSGDVRPGLVASLAKGREDLDATRFQRPVLAGVKGAALRDAEDLGALGLPLRAPADVVTRLAASATTLDRARGGPATDTLKLRADLGRTGVVGQAHVEAARALASETAARVAIATQGGAAIDTVTLMAASTGALLTSVATAASAAGGRPGVGLVVRGPELEADSTGLSRPARPIDVGVLDLARDGTLVVRTPVGEASIPVARLDESLHGDDVTGVVAVLPDDTIRLAPSGGPAGVREPAALPVIARNPTVVAPTDTPSLPAVLRGAVRAQPRPASGPALSPMATGVRPPVRPGTGPTPTEPVVVTVPVVDRGPRPGAREPLTVTVPPLLTDTGVLARLGTAVALQRDTTHLFEASPTGTVVSFPMSRVRDALHAHLDPVIAQPLRRDALISLAGTPVGDHFARELHVDGWWTTRAVDRVMAYPTFPLAAYTYLARYDRTRFCPGIDDVPTNSVTLLETNPRFIAAFMAGLNHETNRELLWRRYPTDARGTPFRRFWARLDGKDDIAPIHGWRAGSLAEQTTDPKGNLVLLVRGELIRRYPNTIVVAMPALGPRTPDRSADALVEPVFAGQFEPDISFFGFPLVDTDLQRGEGWFFALMEPVTEPRFGLDETEGGPSGGGEATASDALSWPATGVVPGGHLGAEAFGHVGLHRASSGAADVAATFYQRPFALYVHAKHLVEPLEP